MNKDELILKQICDNITIIKASQLCNEIIRIQELNNNIELIKNNLNLNENNGDVEQNFNACYGRLYTLKNNNSTSNEKIDALIKLLDEAKKLTGIINSKLEKLDRELNFILFNSEEFKIKLEYRNKLFKLKQKIRYNKGIYCYD